MQTYLFPIKIALITFPILAFLFTFPFVIYQYRKHGYINKFRVFILYSFLLYLLAAYYLVILPLPKTHDVRSLQPINVQYYQLMPFNFIFDFLKETKVVFSKPSTYINIVKERAFLQAAFNAILLMPLGIYLRYYFKKNLKQTVLICFSISLFFEVTQVSALYGFYNAPYRIFDVDDLILNTLGGYIGYKIAPMFTYFFPKADQLDENIDLKSIPVSFFRRLLAFSIDWFILELIFPSLKTDILFKAILVFVYFILIVYITNGKTFGKWILRIKIKGKKDRLSFKEAVTRYSILYYGVFGFNYLLSQAISLNRNIQWPLLIFIMIAVLIIFDLIFFVHILLHIFKKDKRLFYEEISKTKNVITK
ncbi:VanZ family protein [Haloimpatiens sp. FM7330]|uniref:VanZ family protein n=1 Tax=Haloimpatiens sp. FM7330 TaxID=3298610 RepID=UPI00362650A9